MRCPRCLNEDERYFFAGSKGVYCRKCVSFRRQLLDDPEEYYYQDKEIDTDYQLPFALTPQQQKLSEQLTLLIDQQDVLVYAACGAGKTEIVMASIKKYLNAGKRVAFATPRRQVVIEIGQRLRTAFTGIKVTWVCSGYTNDTEGDLIVCTTHQLYRYSAYFDLLILDEPDAFPFRGNDVLAGIAKTSCVGHTVYLTATPNRALRQLATLTLFKRPHGFALCLPQVWCGPGGIAFLVLKHWLRDKQRVLIFVPTINMSVRLAKQLGVPCFNSHTEDKDKIIQDFKAGRWPYLVCTTVLERGITISNIDVCVYHAEHVVFDEASLIQMIGRVGRDIHYPSGQGIFICTRKERKITGCLNTIRMMNA